MGGSFKYIAMALVIFFLSSGTTDANLFSFEPDLLTLQIKSCNVDNDCASIEQCLNQKCVGVCNVNKNKYAKNAVCRAVNHIASWTCPKGYSGEPLERCTKVCATNDDCATVDVCMNNMCIPGCELKKCGMIRKCFPRIHKPSCIRDNKYKK